MMHSLLMRLMKEQHNNIITCLYENSCTKSLYDHILYTFELHEIDQHTDHDDSSRSSDTSTNVGKKRIFIKNQIVKIQFSQSQRSM